MTTNTTLRPSGALIDGYALVLGSIGDSLQKLASVLWEHGVPAYAAPSVFEIDKAVAARGKPAFILLLLDRLNSSTIVDLEHVRMRHDLPLLCIAPADVQPPHIQALLQMATDFIIAPYQPAELLIRIRRLSAATRLALAQVHTTSAQVRAKPPAPLTQTERAILSRLSQNLGEPVALDDLAVLIPGNTDGARIRLLRVHIFRLRQKIEPSPKNPTYVRTVRDFGYYLTAKVEGVE